MSAELIGLSKYCGKTQTGLSSLLYSNYLNVEAEPELIQSNGTMQGDFAFYIGTWLEAYIISSINKLNLQIKSNNSKQGNRKEITLRAVIKTANETIFNELNRMERMKFILLTTDKNGVKLILGTKESPLSFTYSYTCNNKTNTYSIQFKGLMDRAPYIYVPS